MMDVEFPVSIKESEQSFLIFKNRLQNWFSTNFTWNHYMICDIMSSLNHDFARITSYIFKGKGKFGSRVPSGLLLQKFSNEIDKGSCTNHLDRIWGIFDLPSPYVDQFSKCCGFLSIPSFLFAHVVCTRPPMDLGFLHL